MKNRTCCYFDDIIKLDNFDLDNISLDKKSHENILIYNILYKNLIDSKPLRNDGTIYLTFFGSKKCDATYNRIGYIISVKSAIT